MYTGLSFRSYSMHTHTETYILPDVAKQTTLHTFFTLPLSSGSSSLQNLWKYDKLINILFICYPFFIFLSCSSAVQLFCNPSSSNLSVFMPKKDQITRVKVLQVMTLKKTNKFGHITMTAGEITITFWFPFSRITGYTSSHACLKVIWLNNKTFINHSDWVLFLFSFSSFYLSGQKTNNIFHFLDVFLFHVDVHLMHIFTNYQWKNTVMTFALPCCIFHRNAVLISIYSWLFWHLCSMSNYESLPNILRA